MCDIKEIEYSLELPIGTRFYYKNHLHEVVESERNEFHCLKCVFFEEFSNNPICQIMKCARSYSKRHDGKCVIFKEVEQNKEGK